MRNGRVDSPIIKYACVIFWLDPHGGIFKFSWCNKDIFTVFQKQKRGKHTVICTCVSKYTNVEMFVKWTFKIHVFQQIGSGTRAQYSSQETSRSTFSSSPLTSSALTNHLQSSALTSQLSSSLPSDMTSSLSNSQATAAVDALVSTFTQQGQNIAASANLDQIGNTNLLPPVVSQNSSTDASSAGNLQSVLQQQRPKPQKSKLPPPSKVRWRRNINNLYISIYI